MAADPFKITVTDSFLSFDPQSEGYFLGRSVVIHAVNGTRIACAKYLLLLKVSWVND